jgi:hypothetical protein
MEISGEVMERRAIVRPSKALSGYAAQRADIPDFQFRYRLPQPLQAPYYCTSCLSANSFMKLAMPPVSTSFLV